MRGWARAGERRCDLGGRVRRSRIPAVRDGGDGLIQIGVGDRVRLSDVGDVEVRGLVEGAIDPRIGSSTEHRGREARYGLSCR